MDVESIVAVLSLLLSVGLAVLYHLDRRAHKFELSDQYCASLLQWHAQVVEQLIVSRCLNRDRASEQHRHDLARLSSLIEQGRFMFPNIDKGDGFGSAKPPAYRGYRNLVLDFLIRSYRLLQAPPSEDTRLKLEMLQRHFTSAVYEVVKPMDRLKTIGALTDWLFAREETIEDFLRSRDGSLISHIWDVRSRG